MAWCNPRKMRMKLRLICCAYVGIFRTDLFHIPLPILKAADRDGGLAAAVCFVIRPERGMFGTPRGGARSTAATGAVGELIVRPTGGTGLGSCRFPAKTFGCTGLVPTTKAARARLDVVTLGVGGVGAGAASELAASMPPSVTR